MSAYGHQMEQTYSARSLSSGSEMRSSYVLESGFYITSFAATIFVGAFAAIGLLLITLLVSLAMMLQSCQNNKGGLVELRNINDHDYSYCKVYSLHAKLNNLEEHNLPSICKNLAIEYVNGGQYARDLELTKSVIEDYFKNFTPSDDDLDVVLIDIDDIFPPVPHSPSNLFQSHISNCIFEAKNLKHKILLRLYKNLQASGWSIILLSREPEIHRNATTNYLFSVGFSGWSSLMMRTEDEDSTKGEDECFSKQSNVIKTKGLHIKSIISSRIDALIVADTETQKFLLPDPLCDRFEQQMRA